jgi:hypothetical protein
MLTLKNPRIPEVDSVEVEALADTGAQDRQVDINPLNSNFAAAKAK